MSKEPLTEEEIIAVLKRGFPLPPQERIDALLERCLEILNSGEGAEEYIDENDEVFEERVLDDDELELAVAAGDIGALQQPEDPTNRFF